MAEYIVVAILGVVALGAVAYPLIAGHARYAGQAELDDDLARYREAVAAGTVCPRCRWANPAGSRFCTDCGRELEAE